MRHLMAGLSVLVLIGCEKKDATPAADTTAMVTPPAATMNLSSMAGRWNVQVMPEGRDTVVTTYVLNATADTAGWTLTFPRREPLPYRILVVSGDSAVSELGPYESVLRPGVQATTRSVSRMRGDTMVSTVVVTYASGPDSIVRLTARGTRAP